MSTTANPVAGGGERLVRARLADVRVADGDLADASLAVRQASVRRREAVQRAVAAGATHQEVANVLGCSRVYVTQLVNQPEETEQ